MGLVSLPRYGFFGLQGEVALAGVMEDFYTPPRVSSTFRPSRQRDWEEVAMRFPAKQA